MNDITLPVTGYDETTDSVMKARSMPALTGNGDHDLLCGGCGEVVAKGLTPEAIAHAFDTDRRLLLQCMCGAYNRVREAKAGARPAN